MTALIAIFSIERSTRFGGTEARISSDDLVVPSNIRNTRSDVGGTKGSPSDQPNSYILSTSSSAAANSTKRLPNPDPYLFSSEGSRSGLTLRDPQPGLKS